MMDPDRLAEEIRGRMIRQSLLNLDFASQTRHKPDRRTMMDYQRTLRETKTKVMATDSLIRRVRAAEIDLKDLKKEAAACKERNRRSRREFIKKLQLLEALLEPEHSENNANPELNEATEDQKAILLLNNQKRSETLRKEARLLMEIIFERKMTREHSDLLQKEYHKHKFDNFVMF